MSLGGDELSESCLARRMSVPLFDVLLTHCRTFGTVAHLISSILNNLRVAVLEGT